MRNSKEQEKQERRERKADIRERNIAIVKLVAVIGVFLIIGTVVANAVNKKNRSNRATANVNVQLAANEKVTGEYIAMVQKDIEEYAVQKNTVTGEYKWVDGSIPFLTKTGFTLCYTADVRAGINAGKMTVECSPETVYVTIPHAVILSADINMDDVRIVKERKALFNHKHSQDLKNALLAAEQSARDNAISEGILEKADAGAVELVTKYFEAVADGRKVEVYFLEDQLIRPVVELTSSNK